MSEAKFRCFVNPPSLFRSRGTHPLQGSRSNSQFFLTGKSGQQRLLRRLWLLFQATFIAGIGCSSLEYSQRSDLGCDNVVPQTPDVAAPGPLCHVAGVNTLEDSEVHDVAGCGSPSLHVGSVLDASSRDASLLSGVAASDSPNSAGVLVDAGRNVPSRSK